MNFTLSWLRAPLDTEALNPVAVVAPGKGIDRIAMPKNGIPDLRGFFESDLRRLRDYGFAALDMPDLAGG